MNIIVKRLLIFFIGIPLVVAIALPFQNFYGNLPLNIFVTILTGIGAVELSSMLTKRKLFICKAEAFILGILAPVALLLTVSFDFSEKIIPIIIMTGAGWILLSRVFSKPEKIENIAGYVTAGLTILVYPGFFIYWIVKMSTWGNAAFAVFFLLITFGYDSIAWFAGTLFGKNNKGIIPASPNKSIAGFIGGIIGSILVSIAAVLFFPGIFPSCSAGIPILLRSIILGLFTGIAAALGDLAESAVKRSCNIKDSGTIMFARGGVLDSIDSIAIAAPVFYCLSILLFKL